MSWWNQVSSDRQGKSMKRQESNYCLKFSYSDLFKKKEQAMRLDFNFMESKVYENGNKSNFPEPR